MTENIPNIVAIKKTFFIDEDKNTRLHYAAAYGNIEDVTKEFEDGHEVDPVNYLGWTPLMMATRNGHLKTVELLLEKRADSTRKNDFGLNILLMAISSGNIDILHLILQHLLCGGVSRQNMQSFFSPISLAVLFKNVQMIQYLIEKSFCVNASFVTGITPLMFATALGNVEIINLLISNGAIMEKKTSAKTNSVNTAQVNLNVPPSVLVNQQHQISPQQAFINYPPPMPIATKHSNLDSPYYSQNFINTGHANLPPLVLVSQPKFSPQPPFMNFAPDMPMPRKCSNLESPCFSANLTPLPRAFVEQVFFPPTFSPSHFYSTVPVFASNECLNMRVMHASPFCSPVPVEIPY